MNIRLVLLLAVFLNCYNAISQDHSIRMNIGLSRTNDMLNPYDIYSLEDEFKTGFSGELIYRRAISNLLYAGAGVGFVTMGHKFHIQKTDLYGNNLGVDKTSWTFNYINLPLHIGLEVGEKMYFTADFAVIPAVLVKSKMKSKTQNGFEADVTEQIDKFDLSGRIGLGVGKYLNENLALDMNLSYQQSLIETEYGNAFAYKGDNKRSHLGVSVSLGITYYLSKINAKKL